MSRCAHMMTYLVRNFEELRTCREYRSPYGLQYTIIACTHLLPAAMAPMWRYYAESGDKSDDLGPDSHKTVYISVTLFSGILMTLFNVYSDLEDPFDGNGLDDLKAEIVDGWVYNATLQPFSPEDIFGIQNTTP